MWTAQAIFRLAILVDHEGMHRQDVEAMLRRIDQVADEELIFHLSCDDFGKLQKGALSGQGGWVGGWAIVRRCVDVEWSESNRLKITLTNSWSIPMPRKKRGAM